MLQGETAVAAGEGGGGSGRMCVCLIRDDPGRWFPPLPSSVLSRSVVSSRAPNGFLMTARRHRPHARPFISISTERPERVRRVQKDEGTLKSRCTSSTAHTRCRVLACLNSSPRRRHMNPEVGFGILPGLILPSMFRGGWKKNTISKKKTTTLP